MNIFKTQKIVHVSFQFPGFLSLTSKEISPSKFSGASISAAFKASKVVFNKI